MMLTNSSFSPPLHHCFGSRTSVSIFTAFAITKILLCGHLSILVFYLGHQHWRKQHSTTTSLSDVINYHLAAMELISLAAWVVYFFSNHAGFPVMARAGLYVFSMTVPGETCFHSLTCVERYLAVVHPINYRRLRQSGGVRIRYISIGSVWLLCFGWIGIKPLYNSDLPIIPFFCFLSFALVTVSFCSLSVLWVLIRPGPGDVVRDEKRVNQSKQRAFHTVMAILGVLWLWFVGFLVSFALEASALLGYDGGCMVMMSGVWFGLPSSLVLPLLFLHRAGKLMRCHHRNE